MSQPPPPDVPTLLAAAVTALGGSARPGQERMAREVEQAIESGTHLLVQAGTGTGKSLAYLVPAVRHAVVAEARVVVSTATLALQRQIVSTDIPALLGAVGPSLGREVQVALLKGRGNYLCLHKLGGGYPADEQETLFDLSGDASDHPFAGRGAAGRIGRDVVRLREWAEQTDTGDRDDLDPGVAPRAWAQVSVSALECLGARCPVHEECFAERARAAAGRADLVVTNHAMLAIEATSHPVLPEHDVLVVDEAHELTDRVTSAWSRELSQALVEAAASRARRGAGLPTDALQTAGRQLGAVLTDLPDGRLRRGLPEALAQTLVPLRAELRTLLGALKPDGEADGGRKRAEAAVRALHQVAERIAESGDGDVLWVERADGEVAVHIAPLGVAGLLRDKLLDGVSGILTSATLAIGGSLHGAAGAVGLRLEEDRSPDGAARPAGTADAGLGGRETADAGREGREADGAPAEGLPTCRGVDVGSPFDYARQAILYVAADLPAPTRVGVPAEQHQALAELIGAAGGATLGLFSSRRAAEAAAEALRGRLGVEILCQGEDLLPALVRRFVAEESACLFGTLSLWQGVDVPGPTCRLVTIDRIPFPRPDDPVRSARSDAADAAGASGFMAVAASHAALLLAQGSGRLIRRVEDRGVVAVLDPRLATARYGSFLLASMPPMWRTLDRRVALAALARLADARQTA